jgi:hypothetical protein
MLRERNHSTLDSSAEDCCRSRLAVDVVWILQVGAQQTAASAVGIVLTRLGKRAVGFSTVSSIGSERVFRLAG